MIKSVIQTIAFIFYALQLHPQPARQSADSIKKLPSNYLANVSSKVNYIEHKLDKKTEKALFKMQKEEERLKSRLTKIDSGAAANLFSETGKKYAELQNKLKQKAGQLDPSNLSSYIPYLDTLKTTLRFLEGNGNTLLGQSEGMQGKLRDAVEKVNGLDFKLSQAQSIQQFLKERRQYLKEQLSKFGLARQLKKMNKDIFYYSQSIKEYKETLKDPQKIEAKALSVLREMPAFKKFMQNNSQFASLFGVPGSNPGGISFAGLQTRASVQQLISALPLTGANPQQFIGQQLQNANSQLSRQKNTIRFPELVENYGEMPDFKPNSQKTKSLLKRLEYGANVQFGKVNQFLPSTGEFALSIGYKLNDNGVIGVGSSYKLGLGTGFNNIQFTHQGFGMRSYIDWKIKDGFFVSGGYEKNNLPQLNDISAPVKLNTWQQSGLVGIMKKYPIKGKKGFVQVLFDFLSYQNIPRSQPILFRTGVNF